MVNYSDLPQCEVVSNLRETPDVRKVCFGDSAALVGNPTAAALVRHRFSTRIVRWRLLSDVNLSRSQNWASTRLCASSSPLTET